MLRPLRTFVRASIRRYGPVLAVVIGLAGAKGCQKPEPPPVAYSGPTLAAADLGMPQPVETGENAFVILETDSSEDRFPAALAVVRLDRPDPLFVCGEHLFVAERGWEVATLREEEAAYWNGLLNNVPESRAVFVLDRASVISPDCDLDRVIRSARRIDVDLCLIYGPRMVRDDCAGLAGAIIDTHTGEHVAYVQSEAGPLDFEPPRPDRPKYDRSHQDVNYLAARRFEREVRKCMLELIARDRRAAATRPSPWRDSNRIHVPEESVPVYIVPNHRVGG